MTWGVTEKAEVVWHRGWEKTKRKRQKSWWKRLGFSCVSAVPSLCSAVDSFDWRRDTKSCWTHEVRKPVYMCMCVLVCINTASSPFCLAAAFSHTNRLSTNFLLLRLTNIISFHQVAVEHLSVAACTFFLVFIFSFSRFFTKLRFSIAGYFRSIFHFSDK